MPMTDRVARLRAESLSAQPTISAERAELITALFQLVHLVEPGRGGEGVQETIPRRLPLIGLLLASLVGCAADTYRISTTVTPALGITGPATDFLVARGYAIDIQQLGPATVAELRHDSIVDCISVAERTREGDWGVGSTARFITDVQVTIEGRSYVLRREVRHMIAPTPLVRAHADSLIAMLRAASHGSPL